MKTRAVSAKIKRAWCVELGAEVTIAEARREYLSLEFPPARFTFYCNDPACQSLPKPVMVIGANYRELAEEQEKFVAEYFRSKDLSAHHRDCDWLSPNKQEQKNIDETASMTRNSRQKTTDLVTIFDPRRNVKESTVSGASAPLTGNQASGSQPAAVRGNVNSHGGNSVKGETRTSDLEKLVDSYLEAKDSFLKSDFDAYRFHVTGRGKVGFEDYFKHVIKATEGVVIYGGGAVDKNYEAGIRLKFFDKRDQMPVKIFISRHQLDKYKYRRYITTTIKNVQDSNRSKYLKIYCLGEMSINEKFNQWEVAIADLNHLVLKVISRSVPDESCL